MTHKFTSAVCVVLGIFLFAASAGAASLPTLSMAPLTGDADVVATDVNYLYAITWNGAATTVNGIPFTSYSTRNPASDVLNRYAFRSLQHRGMATNTGTTSTAGIADGAAVKNLLSGFVLNNGTAAGDTNVLSFSNLQEGKTYTLRLFTSRWDGNDRTQTFSFDANADGVADLFQTANNLGTGISSYEHLMDKPFSGGTWAGTTALADDTRAYTMDYTFVAGSNTLHMMQTALIEHGLHLYATALYEHKDIARVMADRPTVKNGSFEVDTFYDAGDAHGYANANNGANNGNFGVISGWTISNAAFIGLAPQWNNAARDARVCGHFLNGTDISVTDGQQAVFIQANSGNLTNYIEQEITGFVEGGYYILSFDARKREGYYQPVVTASLTGESGAVKSYSKTIERDAFRPFLFQFNATDAVEKLRFSSSSLNSSLDTVLLLDNIRLWEMSAVFHDNFSVNSPSSTISASTNDKPGRIGATFAEPYTYKKWNGNGDLSTQREGDTYYAPDAQQVGMAGYDGKLVLRTSDYNGFSDQQRKSGVTLDYDFANLASKDGSTLYQISFRADPLAGWSGEGDFPEAVLGSWAGVLFGGSANDSWVLNGNGVGILIRETGGIQIFDHGAMLGSVPNATKADYYDVDIFYTVDDFVASELVDIQLFINGEHIYDFTTSSGFTENYISLMASLDARGSMATQDYFYTTFDNFVVYGSGQPRTPEPATWVMMILGVVGLAASRVRKGRK